MKTNFGCLIKKPKSLTNHLKFFFGEDQGRYVIEVEQKNIKEVENLLKKNNIFFEIIGNTQKNFFEISGEMKIHIKELSKINNKWYNNF